MSRIYIKIVTRLAKVSLVRKLYDRFYFLRKLHRSNKRLLKARSINPTDYKMLNRALSETDTLKLESIKVSSNPPLCSAASEGMHAKLNSLQAEILQHLELEKNSDDGFDASKLLSLEMEQIYIYAELHMSDAVLARCSGLITRGYVDLEVLRLAAVAAFKLGKTDYVGEVILTSYRYVLAYNLINHIPSKSQRDTIITAHGRFIDEVASLCLEHGLSDMALAFIYASTSITQRQHTDAMIALIHYVQSALGEMPHRAKDMRPDTDAGASNEVNLVGSIVWGEDYVDAFMQYNLRSMLAPGNMPALAEKGLLVHSIVTTASGEQQMRKHPAFTLLDKIASVEFFIFPERLLSLSKGGEDPDKMTYTLYGLLDHLNIAFAKALGANVFLIPVDSVVADGSFNNMRRYLDEGYDCCGGGNLVAERESYLPALDELFPPQSEAVIAASTHQLASLALKNPHHYITSQLIHDENKDFGSHPRELFWPGQGGIYSHSIYTHPLIISARRLAMDFVIPMSWADFLLPARMFSDPLEFDKYKIIDDASEAYINNFAPAKRLYETNHKAFAVDDFIYAHKHSYPIHRHMLKTRQFIPCDYEGLSTSRDINQDVTDIEQSIAKASWQNA